MPARATRGRLRVSLSGMRRGELGKGDVGVGEWEDGWMGGWVDGRMGGWEDGWMGGWVDGRLGGCEDGWMSAFEWHYGSIRDNTKNVSAHRPIYCPKILDFSTVVALNGSWNIDLMKRFSTEIPLLVAGKPLYTWPYPMGSPPDHNGFGVGFPLQGNLSQVNTSRAAASASMVYGTLAASVDVASIAQKVLEELYAPDSSKSFELYDITDPASLFAIVSPVPPHAYFRPDDSRSYMLPSPLSETRPWEGPSVVPLDKLGAGVRKYEAWCRCPWKGPVVVPLDELGASVCKYETWCRHTQPPNTWQSWGIPILIALFTLLLVLLVLLTARIQRAQFFQTQQQMADADRLRRKAEDAEASKSMFVADMSHELRTPMMGIIDLEGAEASKRIFVADMSHELRTPMMGIIGMLDALADMALQPPELSDLLTARGCAMDALHLVNRVLDLAKLEAGKAVVDETVIDVREWLDAALHWHAEEARSKGIACE
ncbi:unnamed protein product [Closterium sp. NIES-65]|nr:unnamed protein product [Closterium sp. NIES-65]